MPYYNGSKQKSLKSKINQGIILKILQKFLKVQNQQPRYDIPFPVSPTKNVYTFKYSKRSAPRVIICLEEKFNIHRSFR